MWGLGILGGFLVLYGQCMSEPWVEDDEFLAPPNYGGEEEDLANEDEVDDVLASPADVVTEDEVVDEPLDGPGIEDEGWSPAQGFRDGRRIVRVWADEQGILKDVRISANWRHKLVDEPLDTAFNAAFMSMNAMLHTGEHRIPAPEPLPVIPYEGAAGWHTIRRARRELADLDAKLEALGDVPPSRWVGTCVEGTALSRAVGVRLGIFGQPVSVRFDPQWLAGSVYPKAISRAVLHAYRRARTKYQPPHVEYGERELLLREHARITDSMMASLKNGFEM